MDTVKQTGFFTVEDVLPKAFKHNGAPLPTNKCKFSTVCAQTKFYGKKKKTVELSITRT